jgi:hypothetical protein
MDNELAIVFAPDLGISAEAFAEEWNATPDAPVAAEAVYPKSVGFDIPPELLQMGMIALSSAGGILGAKVATPAAEALGEFVKERVKAWLHKTFPEKADTVEVSTITQPDGAVLFVVHEEGA